MAGLGEIMKMSLRIADPKTEIRIYFFLECWVKGDEMK
jgi:hypothetical protein